MPATKTILSDLCFPEGPRWHAGALWFSDMHDRRILKVYPNGLKETVVLTPSSPSGLGWMPNGDLLIVSMEDKKILRWNGKDLDTHSNLEDLASFHCNDMVVNENGRAYVGNFGFDLHGRAAPKKAELICVEPSGEARVVAKNMEFPNGTVISSDGKKLIVAETWASCLTAFDIRANGNLGNRRVWAKLDQGAVPDGICLDQKNGIWSASPSTNECVRQIEGGEITHRVQFDQGAFACMLGGESGKTLFVLTAGSSNPKTCKKRRSGRIEMVEAPYEKAGYP
tara:strand:- start:167 stop:1012 length:846 start_codon:yes stop_codon:yes gene_type:complete